MERICCGKHSWGELPHIVPLLRLEEPRHKPDRLKRCDSGTLPIFQSGLMRMFTGQRYCRGFPNLPSKLSASRDSEPYRFTGGDDIATGEPVQFRGRCQPDVAISVPMTTAVGNFGLQVTGTSGPLSHNGQEAVKQAIRLASQNEVRLWNYLREYASLEVNYRETTPLLVVKALSDNCQEEKSPVFVAQAVLTLVHAPKVDPIAKFLP